MLEPVIVTWLDATYVEGESLPADQVIDFIPADALTHTAGFLIRVTSRAVCIAHERYPQVSEGQANIRGVYRIPIAMVCSVDGPDGKNYYKPKITRGKIK